ncbi:DUF4253 domain-containing protein [Kineosporia rhizophila]|uniref:DUF4253 domain-containing protein n=1 Tax=Kineosporia rhizophila TaxID=84633 RepID=UPI001E557B45|nr:DUF4253 domain-containing protein [Kineosporia rhizophila]
MLNEPRELMDAFRGTALEGLNVETVPQSDVLLVTWLDPKNLLAGWQAARDLMAVTGRRPVAVGEEFRDEFFEVEAAELQELETAVHSLDPWPEKYALEAELDRKYWSMDEVDLETVSQLLNFRGSGPAWDSDAVARELLPGIPAPTTDYTLNEHLLKHICDAPERLAQLGPVDESETSSGALDWYKATEVHLALLPTTSPWLSAAWLYYFGEDDTANLAACMRQWNEAWGAEIVASWGTMLQFVTTRRPAFGPEAFELARQHLAMAGNLHVPPLQLAWELAHTNAWFLHERP